MESDGSLYSQIKSVMLPLVPFIITCTLYFGLQIPSETASFFAALVKCLPILSLIIFVLLQGIDSLKNIIVRRKIGLGLLFSCLGDALLVWPNLFIHGMLAFGVGHVMYISALGFKPLRLIPGVILYILSSIMIYILMPGLTAAELKIGVPIYSFLLATMTWRAIVKMSRTNSGSINWSGIVTGLGGISWLLSDAFLGCHYFYHPLPHSQVLIMTTYYFGQLGITISILNIEASKRE